jgi:hypothetical protein
MVIRVLVGKLARGCDDCVRARLVARLDWAQVSHGHVTAHRVRTVDGPANSRRVNQNQQDKDACHEGNGAERPEHG